MNRSDALNICLSEITGKFENGGVAKWNGLSNSFDGRGPSVGVLSFSFGAGGLQPLIKNMDLTKYFTTDQAKQLGLRMNLDSIETQKDWANKTMFDPQGHFIPEWKTGWIKLAGSQEFKDAQLKGVEHYADIADGLVKWIGINTLRCFALAFDFAVENGGLKQEVRDLAAKKRMEQFPIAAERGWMKLIVDTKLSFVRPQYQSDFRARKYSIIEGGGIVHQDSYNFDSLNLEQEYIIA